MTHVHVELRPGAYADSVALLQVSRAVQGVDGVLSAQVAMATPLNVDVLTGMGFTVPEQASPNDMVVALQLASADQLGAALAGVDGALRDAARRSEGGSAVAPPRTTASALRRAPGALALVSVPGPNAMVEAMDAVEAGSDVMIFSDNVPIEHELALKRAAAERAVLVMGPDCGTAVVGGIGLGFANVVSPGPVGIVAASGTGCQQLLALLDHAGVGVSSALGVGGRDLSSTIRGRSTREALRRLDADPTVELIVVISKPPAADVADEIAELAASLATPVKFALLGPGRPDLTAAAEAVLRRLGHEVPAWPVSGAVGGRRAGRGTRLHGLFVGGTLKSEAALIAAALLGDDLLGGDQGHSFIDFGDDAYTAGRAHPMIDPTLRLDHLRRAAADPETAVILLDVVLGHGAEDDPAALLAPAISSIHQPVIVAVIGTDTDPQDRERQVAALTAAGAEVHLSNADATRRAVALLGGRA